MNTLDSTARPFSGNTLLLSAGYESACPPNREPWAKRARSAPEADVDERADPVSAVADIDRL
jgi:hypothetical protein